MSLVKNIGIFIIVFAIFAFALSRYTPQDAKPEDVSLNVVATQIIEGTVEKIEIEQEKLTIILNDETEHVSHKEPGESLATTLSNFGVSAEQLRGIEVIVKQDSAWVVWMSALLPFLVPILLIGVFIYFMMRQVQGANSKAMSFGQSTARQTSPNDGKKKKTTFKEVAGAKEAKEELQEVVEFLQNPQKFLSLGAKIPKGVLLVGPPGTGKTLIARAVAGEAGVPFFHISGSEFVEMFVGVGASRVRDLFRKAKKSAPCIVFMDEIDAVGRQRGTGLGGSHDEREQTLNQILVEMDGFDTETNVIVIAATNRPDVLDPALLRPGRFDRRVTLDLPDISEREQILKIHASNKPLEENVDIRKIAERTPGFSGADLENLLNEAAIFTARKNKKIITMEELLPSIEKVILGPERKSRVISDKEKKITAYHEAGHALVGHLLPNTDPVHKISIIPRGRAGGYTMSLPSEDKYFHSKSEFIDELAMMLGGYAAEEIFFGDITTGPSSDLQRATKTARNIVTRYGMSDKLGPRTFGKKEEMIFLGKEMAEEKDYSEETAKSIDDEISALVEEALKTAKKIITEKKPVMEKVVAALLEKETLEKEAFEDLLV
ncbi:MAG: ATP-dependent zinc metalloprotease FtsH [Candidatus Jacksonbacteria bacterium]|jgi:cell division protease FtsH|nr:ATP-dependent zinc metalloprotease FtsH [Candidatus Jacksonbacteria bacterium]MBT6034551.1 ATP-dependent zinc metalloprotease FtsH [Candidatus Jacksonbacteria bacterium]MBT6756911.1 ATP-dependent zinc metalloprotease FtsH [Candidatus Jacksonbacteria bacterium]MBT6955445.1 ATP-dependent zinc metalloprotease FtsH [Candidatus Jacksonbacteria bacterium]MBT7008549.1 ATP-dependent zinc metalloprotease FtsH [Candidatus Jacksonbacteria bacterium]